MTSIVRPQQLFQAVRQNRRYLTIFLFGIASGLPSCLVASTLQAWFTENGLNLHTIGAVTLLVLPYSCRFLWTPLFDHYQSFKGLDRRRGWLFLMQFGLFISISSMALQQPTDSIQLYHINVPILMLLGLMTAILSASQDSLINAWQVDIFPIHERGLSAAMYVTGWRIGALLSGSLALVIAQFYNWEITYFCMALLMLLAMCLTLLAEAAPEERTLEKDNFFFRIKNIINDFYNENAASSLKTFSYIILLILTYKLGEALALSLNTTFLLRYIGFSLTAVGLVNKTISMSAALLGGLVAGVWMQRLSLYRALFLFGMIQAVANLGYVLLAIIGKNYSLLVITAFLENFCSAMGNIALIAFLMALSKGKNTVTRFALFSSLVFLPRTLVGPYAASLVTLTGWPVFFVCCFLCALPSILFVFLCKKTILTASNV